MTDRFDDRVQRALAQRAARVARSDDALDDIRRRARRQRRTRVAGMVVVALAVLGAGLIVAPRMGQPDVVLAPADPSPTPAPPAPSPTAEATTAPAGPKSCDGRELGVAYRVRYPAAWWASDGTDAEPCRWFHPEPFDMPSGAQDVPGVAISVRVADTPFDKARQLDTDPDELPADVPPDEVLSQARTTVDGRRAAVQEYLSGLDGIYPRGTTFYRFLVAVGDHTLVATTTDSGGADYDARKAALDRIRAHLEVLEVGATFRDGQPSCSAAARGLSPEPQAGLPDAVAETRAVIIEAATGCAYEGLAEIAGEDFTYRFDGGDDVAGFLRRGEDGPPRPLRYLVELLHRPYATVQVRGQTQYVWPSAFAYDSWAAVPEADREALEPLYDEDSFADFARFGSYTGYRVGIAADGDWRFFVAGD